MKILGNKRKKTQRKSKAKVNKKNKKKALKSKSKLGDYMVDFSPPKKKEKDKWKF